MGSVFGVCLFWLLFGHGGAWGMSGTSEEQVGPQLSPGCSWQAVPFIWKFRVSHLKLVNPFLVWGELSVMGQMLVWWYQDKRVWSGVSERIGGGCVLEFSLSSGGFSTMWESSLSFCLWISLEMKPHFCSTAMEWQFVVGSLESLQFVVCGFPWSGSGSRSELPFCSVNREEVNLRSSSSVMVTDCFYLRRVSCGWYFVPHKVLLLELLSLTVFLKQQFLPPLLFWIVLVLGFF